MYLPVHHHSHCHTANNKRQHINIHVHAKEDCIMGRVINEVCVSVNCTQFSVAFSLSRGGLVDNFQLQIEISKKKITADNLNAE